MVASHICDIYGIWRSRGEDALSHHLGNNASHKRGEAIFRGKEGWGSHFVILLY